MFEVKFDPSIGIDSPESRDILKFLDEVTCGSIDKRNYLLQQIGYCLMDTNPEHKIFIHYGEGRNGKGVWFNLVNKIFGKHAVLANKSIFIKSPVPSQANAHSAQIYAIKDGKLIWSSETTEGDEIGDTFLKTLSGDKGITCRAPGKLEETFPVIGKAFLLTNHKPKCPPDVSLWDRLQMTNWNAYFTDDPNPDIPTEQKKDSKLEDKLSSPQHICGLFNLILEASVKYHQQGWFTPEIIKTETRTARNESDSIALFVTEELEEVKADKGLKAIDMYPQYQTWCFQSPENFKPKSFNPFSKAISSLLRKFKIVSNTKVYNYMFKVKPANAQVPPNANP